MDTSRCGNYKLKMGINTNEEEMMDRLEKKSVIEGVVSGIVGILASDTKLDTKICIVKDTINNIDTKDTKDTIDTKDTKDTNIKLLNNKDIILFTIYNNPNMFNILLYICSLFPINI